MEGEKLPQQRRLQPCPSGSQLPVTREPEYILLEAGVNPPQLLKSLQGTHFVSERDSLCGIPSYSPQNHLLLGIHPLQESFNALQIVGMHNAPDLVQRQRLHCRRQRVKNYKKYISFQAFRNYTRRKSSCVCRPKHLLVLLSFLCRPSKLTNAHYWLFMIWQ